MTLILTHANSGRVLQVGDRLVTEHPSGEEFDPRSNKQVIYRAKDGLVAIGYSGLAFIEGSNTDTWIAHRLRGGSPAGGGPDRWAMHIGAAKRSFDLGGAARQLCRDLGMAVPVVGPSVIVIAAGWQWDRRGRNLRPVMWGIARSPSGSFTVTRWPRWWGPHSQLCTIPVGAIEKTTQRALFDAVDAVGFDTEAALALLVAAIRRAASVRAPALIGSECMAIELPPPIGERNPRILYLEPVGPPAERFTPWLVSEHGMFAPSQVTGGGWALTQVDSRSTSFR